MSKGAPNVRQKETPTVVVAEDSKFDSESEAGKIIDVVQTMKQKKAEDNEAIIF